ncbi:MAG: hypothetical protein LUC49_02195 [Prevotella sp.]|nr:hypothetical protein [Prevotella sp.]
MKKFIIRLVAFALIMLVCDLITGFVGDRLFANAKGGETKRKIYVAREVNTDVLVFGSSRALHHYDPDVLSNELGMSVYNCGMDGMGIICAYGFYKLATARYFPKVVLYDVFPASDIILSDNTKYLRDLYHFYDCEGIDSIFLSIENNERYKMVSKMYRFNSELPMLVMDNLHPVHDYNNGYSPVDREMAVASLSFSEEEGVKRVDSLKLYYLERLINECEGKTRLIFTVSPLYENPDDKMLEPVKTLCREYDIPLLNHYTDTAFIHYRDFFYDRVHLNTRGATAYSKTVAHEIKHILSDKAKGATKN